MPCSTPSLWDRERAEFRRRRGAVRGCVRERAAPIAWSAAAAALPSRIKDGSGDPSEGRAQQTERRMRAKVFTLEEANRLVPRARTSIRLMQKAVEEAEQLRDAFEVLVLLGAEDEASPEHADYLRKRERLQFCRDTFREEHDRLEESGALLRDLQAGLVDFHALRGGRLVFLCWRLGEEAIGYWHEIDSGFAGRRPIHEF
jgi:hypothetical protein